MARSVLRHLAGLSILSLPLLGESLFSSPYRGFYPTEKPNSATVFDLHHYVIHLPLDDIFQWGENKLAEWKGEEIVEHSSNLKSPRNPLEQEKVDLAELCFISGEKDRLLHSLILSLWIKNHIEIEEFSPNQFWVLKTSLNSDNLTNAEILLKKYIFQDDQKEELSIKFAKKYFLTPPSVQEIENSFYSQMEQKGYIFCSPLYFDQFVQFHAVFTGFGSLLWFMRTLMMRKSPIIPVYCFLASALSYYRITRTQKEPVRAFRVEGHTKPYVLLPLTSKGREYARNMYTWASTQMLSYGFDFSSQSFDLKNPANHKNVLQFQELLRHCPQLPPLYLNEKKGETSEPVENPIAFDELKYKTAIAFGVGATKFISTYRLANWIERLQREILGNPYEVDENEENKSNMQKRREGHE